MPVTLALVIRAGSSNSGKAPHSHPMNQDVHAGLSSEDDDGKRTVSMMRVALMPTSLSVNSS